MFVDFIRYFVSECSKARAMKIENFFLKSHVVKRFFAHTFENSIARNCLPWTNSSILGEKHRHWNSPGDTFFPAVSHLGYVKDSKLAYASSRTSSAILLRSCSSTIKTIRPRNIHRVQKSKRRGDIPRFRISSCFRIDYNNNNCIIII